VWNVAAIVEGYASGYFLMDDGSGSIEWYGTRERTLIPLDERFHYPRSLRRVLHRQLFSVRINSAFEQVVEGCAHRSETWINENLISVYRELYAAGWAFSFETWVDETLAGGILGLAIGGVFIGESMFYAIPDGSKVAMVKLVEHLRQRHFLVFDAQLSNPHLSRFGAITVPQAEYLNLLAKAVQRPCCFDSKISS
jgi:leucyl/phenylalanyl-tRNA--protein transferase